jgi:hypothetical protein
VSSSHIFGVEIEVFPRQGDIEIQPDLGVEGYLRATPYVYRAVYANLGYLDPVRNKRFFLPKQELHSIGNVLKSPPDLEINALNVWLREGQSVRFTAYLEDETMRALRATTVAYKQWTPVTDLYQFDSVAKTATCELVQDVPMGKCKIVFPPGLTGTMTLSILSTGNTTTTTAINLAQPSTTITLPVAETWVGKVTFNLSVTTGNFPESFQIYAQDK